MSLSNVVPSLRRQLFKPFLDFLPLGLLQEIVAAFEEFFKRVRDPRIDRRYGNNVASLLQLDPQMLRASVLVLELDEPAKITTISMAVSRAGRRVWLSKYSAIFIDPTNVTKVQRNIL